MAKSEIWVYIFALKGIVLIAILLLSRLWFGELYKLMISIWKRSKISVKIEIKTKCIIHSNYVLYQTL